MRRTLTVPLLAFLLFTASACAGPLTTREKGAVIGAAAGGAAGAAVGHALGHPGLGAAVGAAVGTVGGWVIGDHAQAAQTPAPPAAPAPATPPPPPLPPLTPTAPAADPTAGVFANTTPWTLTLSVAPADAPSQVTAFTVGPNALLPHALDVGHYRVAATASVHTQFGPRTVGRSERTFSVDPRAQGWRVEFRPHDFR